jgi:hypothetical protein
LNYINQMGALMSTPSSLVRICFVVLLFSGSLTVSACGTNKLDGVYAGSNGQNTVEFRDGKAFVTMVGMASDGIPYDAKGNTITIHAGGTAGDLVLTRNSDGTLQGPFGIMRKK